MKWFPNCLKMLGRAFEKLLRMERALHQTVISQSRAVVACCLQRRPAGASSDRSSSSDCDQ